MKATMRTGATFLTFFLLLFLSPPLHSGAAGPDPDQKAGITIHALQAEQNTQLEQSRPGAEIPGLSGYRGINGISFTITRVRDGSESIHDAPAHTGNGAYRQTRVTGRVNGQDGIAVFDGLPLGTYLVQQEPHAKYIPAVPVFLLDVPLPDPLGAGDLHDIHLYPKYSAPEGTRDPDFTKEVKKRIGNEVVWEFSWVIPDNIANGLLLTLTDELDARMRIKSINGKPAIAVRYRNRSGRVSTLPTRYYEVEVKDNTVTLTIESDAGFEQLAKALLPENGRREPTLSIELTTVIKSGASGTIYNSGVLEFEDMDGNKESSTPKRDPFVRIDDGIGGICIYKYDGNTNMPLSGAEFQMFRTKSDALEGRLSIAEGTTGSDGYLLIEDLEYEGGGTSYWIVETKAPVADGKQYNLLPAPVEVRVGPYSHLKSNQVEVQNNSGPLQPAPGAIDADGTPGAGAKVSDSGGMGRRPYYLVSIFLLMTACLLLVHYRIKTRPARRKEE